jgi:hypothetical protein
MVVRHVMEWDWRAPAPAEDDIRGKTLRKKRLADHSQVDRAREHCIRFSSVSSLRRNVPMCDLAVTPGLSAA